MKKFKIFTGILAAVLALAACTQKEEDYGEDILTISPSGSIEFPQEGGEVKLKLNSTISWGIRISDEAKAWLAITPDKGEGDGKDVEVTLKATANTEADREVTITFYGNIIAKAPLTISQQGLRKDDVETLAVAEFISRADEATTYRLTGTVSSSVNTEYCSFNLTDETGTIIVWTVNNASELSPEGKTWGNTVKKGDTVTLRGKYLYYEAKGQHEVVDAYMEECVSGSSEDDPVVDPSDYIYYNDFDKEAAVQTSSKWPYLDATEAWRNEKGSGISSVSYESAVVSLRNNSNSDGNYSDYDGSGVNNLFFGASSHFRVNNISLGGKRNIKLLFGSEKYDNSDKTATFNVAEFPVKVSVDGNKWLKLDYKFNGTEAGRWNTAEATFTVPEGSASLYLYFAPTVASVYRLDDLTLTESSAEGTVLDFSKAGSLDDDDEEEEDTVESISVADFIKNANTSKYYRLSGTVVTDVNTTYCSFDLKDETGQIYVYSVNNKSDWANVVKKGGTVTLRGKYYYYSNNSQHEVVNAYIEEFKEAEAPSTKSVTVAEFIAAEVSTTQVYQLSGTVASIDDEEYGDFYLKDDSGEVLIYGPENWDSFKASFAVGGDVKVEGLKATKVKSGKTISYMKSSVIKSYTAK